jgi:hypothetical protein
MRVAAAFPVALLLSCLPLRAQAGDDALERPLATSAPLEIPHAANLELDEKSRKRARKPRNIESHDFLVLSPGLRPVTWPKYSDLRARLVTPEVRNTPVFGWIAENLYRSRNDTGWCLEVDPGEGEYVVFYRYHPRR